MSKANLLGAALFADLFRIGISTPFTFLLTPVVGWFVGFITGIPISIFFFLTYSTVFDIHFMERLPARFAGYFLGSATPFGTLIGTSITIVTTGIEDRRYNEMVLKKTHEEAATRAALARSTTSERRV